MTLRDRRVRLVAGARDAPEFVEPLVGRLAAALREIAAQVPLAKQRRRIPGRLQGLGDGHFPQRDAAGLRGARSNRVASGHERRPRHGAGELDVEVVEPNAVSGELVEARRDVAAHAAVGADFSPAKVVGKDQDNVRARGLGRQLAAGCQVEGPGNAADTTIHNAILNLNIVGASSACELAAAEARAVNGVIIVVRCTDDRPNHARRRRAHRARHSRPDLRHGRLLEDVRADADRPRSKAIHRPVRQHVDPGLDALGHRNDHPRRSNSLPAGW